eukprot:TRINITY_DN2335_c1_g1_i4.p2 TRINITY_DN2335_c1_g1~~TRINITY_DN2335_c1_g1_i4.p2  ORF type:complete len:259 (+),score=82.32 TRINITY_DN2335_c1_g1_i4:453-1229(+)
MPPQPKVSATLDSLQPCTSCHRGIFFDLEASAEEVAVTHIDVAMGWRSGTVRIFAYNRDGRVGAFQEGKDGPIAWEQVSEPVRVQANRAPYGDKQQLTKIPLKKGGVPIPAGEKRGFVVHSSDGFVAFSAAGCPEVVADDGVLVVHRGEWTTIKNIDSRLDWLYTIGGIKPDGRGFVGRVHYTVPESKKPDPVQAAKAKVGDRVRLTPVGWIRREGAALADGDVGTVVTHLDGHVAPYQVEYRGETSWYCEQHLERTA